MIGYHGALSYGSFHEQLRSTKSLCTSKGKTALSCVPGITHCVPQVFLHITNPLLTKHVWSRWLNIQYSVALFPFNVVMALNFVSVHKHTKKALGQYPAILTLCLVRESTYIRCKLSHRMSCIIKCELTSVCNQFWVLLHGFHPAGTSHLKDTEMTSKQIAQPCTST